MIVASLNDGTALVASLSFGLAFFMEEYMAKGLTGGLINFMGNNRYFTK
ncbi:hypothetical protein [Clostridium sp. HBUAS56017]|nr:hypothetical protein [Clostridium sp. HBUAS56017]